MPAAADEVRQGPGFCQHAAGGRNQPDAAKTQAALLEAMQEHQVTVGRPATSWTEPFFVLATQNPIEMEGTYPLPEAQLDRFMFNVIIDYLPEADEIAVVGKTTQIDDSKPERALQAVPTSIRFQQSRAEGSRSRRNHPLRRPLGYPLAPEESGVTGFHKSIRELGSWSPRGPEPHSWRQGQGTSGRSHSRHPRRRHRSRWPGSAPSRAPELPRRGRRHQR